MPNTQSTPKRDGGEKRGNKYDRMNRLSRLSVDQAHDAPVLPVTVPGRRRIRGEWIHEDRTLPMRAENHCEHCECAIYCDPATREIENYRAEQDRIDPSGGYTLDNL